jgi:hypothetical protein
MTRRSGPARLLDVGLDAEPHPGGRVALGLVGAALHLLERRVVRIGVATEVLLDRYELWCEQALAGEDERLDDPRDTAVAVAERVHGYDVEMRHRGAHDDMSVEVAAGEPVDDLAHELGDVVMGRPDIRRCAAARVRDLDAASTVPAGVLVLLEVAGVEVKVEDDAVNPAEDGVVRHDADVVHRTGVARQCHAVVVVGIGRRVAAGNRDGLLLRDMEPLDFDRALG